MSLSAIVQGPGKGVWTERKWQKKFFPKETNDHLFRAGRG